MNELKGCPFCGDKPAYSWYEDESLYSHEIVFWYKVECKSCDFSMDACDHKGAVFAAWNTRTPEST